MGNKKKVIKNFASVVTSNLTTILSGVFVGFILPKILNVDSYGYYKTFTLYLSYIGFFSLGIVDGIVLKYGDKDYEQINQRTFRSFFIWYFFIQLFFSFLICVASILFLQGTVRVIGIFVAVDMIAINVTGYFQQISQITQRFGEYSCRKILQSFLNILSICILHILFKFGILVGHEIYILSIICINWGLSFWYVKTYRDIIFGNFIPLQDTKKEIEALIKEGFPLLFANLCSSFILTTDKQFVNLLFDNREFAIYSFAYNMLSLVTVATSAVSTVLYPTLKRTNNNKLKDTYDCLISVLLSFVFIALLVYFPLVPFVRWFLPQYVDSLMIFNIIFPGLAISSCITVIMHNYYKVSGKNLQFFKKSLLVLVISCITNGVAYMIFRSTSSISIASIITILIWYLYVEQDFVVVYGYSRWKNLIYMIVAMIGFYIISNFFTWYVGMIIYLIFITSLTLFTNKKSIMRIMKM